MNEFDVLLVNVILAIFDVIYSEIILNLFNFSIVSFHIS